MYKDKKERKKENKGVLLDYVCVCVCVTSLCQRLDSRALYACPTRMIPKMKSILAG